MFYAYRSVKLNNLDLNKLNAFLAVAEVGGVTGAAGRLGRTPSAVSQSVAGLESSLGVRLFDRVGKRLVLTRAGRTLHARVRDYQAALQRTVDDVVNAEGEIHGLVRLGTFLGFPRARLAPFLASFTSRHTRVEVRIVYAPEADLTTRLLERRLDYSLSFRPRSEVGVRLRSTKLYEQELVLVAGPRFLRDGFDPDELGRTPVVDYYQSDPLITRWLAHHGHAALGPRVVVWAATTDLVLDLVLRGAGVAVLPHHVAAPFLRRRALRIVRGGRRELTDAIWLNEPAGAYRDATLDAFRDALVAELGGEPSRETSARSGR
jgi:DNA-binding transcriptional LysR family regulator